MINIIQSIIPYISGLYTLPWIVVGFIATIILSHIFSREKVDSVMKNIALILLYLFVPALVFRIFLDTPLGALEGIFALVVIYAIILMYTIAYIYALVQVKKKNMTGTTKSLFIKTMITNQGRSSAFVGGIMLAVPGWGVPAGIFMAFVGIVLFAVVPLVLCRLNNRKPSLDSSGLTLPWFLKMYPWYFIIFPITGVFIQKTTGIGTGDLGSLGVLIRFYTALTIPAALYYVGSGMHPSDMKISELKRLLGIDREDGDQHWSWVRHIFIMTTIITPIVVTLYFLILLKLNAVHFPAEWFAVCILNALLPITSTNMFLVPFGIDKRATAHSITWSTIICVPIVIILIPLLSLILGN